MNIVNTAKNYGCTDVVDLVCEPTPRHLDYLDLVGRTPKKQLRVEAVAEFQSRPLLYLVSESQAKTHGGDAILELQQILANRGERAYLGILSPGELNVYPVNLDRTALDVATGYKIGKNDPAACQFFQDIACGTFILEGQPTTADYVFKTIHDLMTESSKRLIGKFELNPLDVLSFLGRALFFRFLWDRRIVRLRELEDICPGAAAPSDCFRNVKSCVATCKWLDETFNGDLLPLSDTYQKVFSEAGDQTERELFRHLQAIIEGWEHIGQGSFQPQLPIDWGDFDFSHIPIGVLSQVYENFSRAWDGEQAVATSVFYTPKNIASYLVDDAFEGVSEKSSAKILDPSCGAGIFLILGFRKLVAARWEIEGKRPDTTTIQSILYNQVRGFDVSESALRLAALSLYITAIELNDSPRPPKKLKFPDPLKNRVLFNHRKSEEKDSKQFVLGSLRPDLSSDFNGQFDLVIGNPPWSRLKSDKTIEKAEAKKINQTHNSAFTKITREALVDRGFSDVAKNYTNPDNNPDLPFLWAATRWAKPKAIIAMTLPSRIFLKQTKPGIQASNAILRGIEITGILNGSNLSDTEVWPKMNQPFMLFFARNSVPQKDHRFYFSTPHLEQQLNEKGRIRIDYSSAKPVSADQIVKQPWLLKTLATGTALDADVMRKLEELKWPTVRSFWDDNNLYSGLGYNRSSGLKQEPADFMLGLHDFVPPVDNGFSVDNERFAEFEPNWTSGAPTLHLPRSSRLYAPPLLIIPQSPGESRKSPKSWIVRQPIAFDQSYYGFSGHGLKSSTPPIALLHLITHSDLFAYHVLMTSSRMGAERRTFVKDNVECFPFANTGELSENQRTRLVDLSHQLERAEKKPWKGINDFIFDLYELDQYDRQVVKDTLEVSAPYKKSRNRANASPKKSEREKFYAELQRLLAPSFDVTGEKVTICGISQNASIARSPWQLFWVSSSRNTSTLQQDLQGLLPQVLENANKHGCSRMVVHGENCLLVGILSQYRYWTPSRARLCALDILRNHMDTFPVENG
ncbi:MAG: N-6 DNA methylase [Kiritimatiellales bacterium]|nr:N-6 DNA methylase [Kiritimatiellales bacterium]